MQPGQADRGWKVRHLPFFRGWTRPQDANASGRLRSGGSGTGGLDLESEDRSLLGVPAGGPPFSTGLPRRRPQEDRDDQPGRVIARARRGCQVSEQTVQPFPRTLPLRARLGWLATLSALFDASVADSGRRLPDRRERTLSHVYSPAGGEPDRYRHRSELPLPGVLACCWKRSGAPPLREPVRSERNRSVEGAPCAPCVCKIPQFP